ncbi:hypothetical protein L2E82_36981 [Cichorium intybus]|uniref:Uncharacterized protein n=1 Tax=Cichorium intybus TaxID=13427 RepID=A0ACB9AER7_CICIN|nr:hypothetical protein L2E82_36981 [Cichorium intybus]
MLLDPKVEVEPNKLVAVVVVEAVELDPNKPDPVNGDGDDVPNNVPVEAAVEAPKPKAGVEDDEDASANPNEGVDDADDEDAPNKGVEDVDELNIEEDEVGFEIENGDGDEDDANENSDGDEDDDDEVKVDKLEEKSLQVIEVDDDAVAPAKLEKEGVTEEEDDPNKVGKDGDAADDEEEVIGGEGETPNDVEEKLGVDVAEEDDDPNKPVEKGELTVVVVVLELEEAPNMLLDPKVEVEPNKLVAVVVVEAVELDPNKPDPVNGSLT